jgi:hypothetical protein
LPFRDPESNLLIRMTTDGFLTGKRIKMAIMVYISTF